MGISTAQISARFPALSRWAQGTVVAGRDGLPLRVFHGTRAAAFTVFEPGDSGMYFSACRKSVRWYAKNDGRVEGFFLRILNPYVTDAEGWEGKAPAPGTIKEDGQHDGYTVLDWAGAGKHMHIAFESAQVKSAERNRGTFSLGEPDFTR